MPVPRQQTPGRATATLATGSLLSRAVPASSMSDEWIHMLLYGRNRIGKTTLACKFPKPLVLVALEPARTGGAKSIKYESGVDVLRYGEHLKTVADVENLPRELAAGKYKTVVLDSGTSLDELVLAHICGWDTPALMLAVGHTRPGAKVSTDQYTQRSEDMRRILKPYLDLERHVVITANEKDHNPRKDDQAEARKSSMVRGPHLESFFAASMGGGTVRWLQDSCDAICQLYMDKEVVVKQTTVNGVTQSYEEETGRHVRKLRTQYHPNFSAGLRSPDPEGVPESIPNPTFEQIRVAVHGRRR